MRVHLTARTRGFTVLGNEVLQDRRLSFTARGLLGYLLSLPDGTREDVRTLAERNTGLGRQSIANALDELVELGYYERRTVRGTDGRVRTLTAVYDTPQTSAEPMPGQPGPGSSTPGESGTSPQGEKNQVKEPTHPAPAPVREIRAHAGERADQPAAAPLPEEHAPAAALLTRLARTEPRLTLGAADTLALAPLAARWLEHGVTELETRSLLTSGLPPRIHSPRALLADRLTRKLPAPRAHSDPYAPAAPLPECTSCGAPLHRGAHARVCARCSTQALSAGSPGRVAGHAEDAPSAGVHVVERAAELRAIVRAARPHHARAA